MKKVFAVLRIAAACRRLLPPAASQ